MKLDETHFLIFTSEDLSSSFIDLKTLPWDTLTCCPYFVYQKGNKDLI